MRIPTAVGLLLAGALLSGALPCASADPALPPILKKVGFDQRLNETIPLETVFRDEAGRDVKLGEYFGAQPVVLVMAYYRCPMLCTQVLNGLVEGLRESRLTMGQDFRVVTVSFDPSDSPKMAVAKKANYIRAYADPKAAADWHFLTGTQASIDRLAQAIGFRYAYDAPSDQYAHAAGIVVLTPAGRISRYFYDVHYSGRDLRLGLVEASQNRIGTAIDQVMLFCFHYDPTAGRYGAAIMNFVRAGGVLTMLTLGLFFAFLRRGERRRRPMLATAPGGRSHGEVVG
ncbi:MAG TPA: SCO family protein [Planctomycetaceae bacterium]|jgi:protein SCO1/2|nr:SCO family protein [Planctomycetaceae bacterium]